MRALPLFWIIPLAAACYVRADDGEKRNKDTSTIRDSPNYHENYPMIVGYDDTDIDDEERRTLKIRNDIQEYLNKTMETRKNDVKWMKNLNTKDLRTRLYNLTLSYTTRHSKLPGKITGGVIVVLVVGGVSICYRLMCRKKIRTESSDREESIPVLPPESCPPRPNPYPLPSPPGPFLPQQQEFHYPQQQVPYPEQKVPYPQSQASYTQQHVPDAPQPNSYPSWTNYFTYPAESTAHPPPISIPLSKA